MVWAGLSATRMFGPLFFHGSVTGQAYHDMLSEWLVSQLQQEDIEDTVVPLLMEEHHTLPCTCVIT
jgi:hypothetical protein